MLLLGFVVKLCCSEEEPFRDIDISLHSRTRACTRADIYTHASIPEI